MQFSTEEPKLLRIQEPALWPDPPSHMSFSVLEGLERCPKRWALFSASYPEIWDRNGYPRQINIGALEGTVIHSCLELVLREISTDPMSTQAADSAVRALRKLGGISSIVKANIEGALSSYVCNPRVTHRLADFYSQLCSRTASIRSAIQRHLSRLRFLSSGLASFSQKAVSGQSSGFYAEVELNALELGWRGRADLLTVSDDFYEIRDFKTGVPKDDDFFQLQVYAFLWHQDATLNPSRRRINRLVLSYNNREEDVPVPEDEKLQTMNYELLERTKVVMETIKSRPIPASPNKEKCSRCGVRHLCNEYWIQRSQTENLSDMPKSQAFSDFQVKLTGRRGPTSWEAEIESSFLIPPAGTILFRTQPKRPLELEQGMRIRILDAFFNMPIPETDMAQSQGPIITLSGSSEVFVLPTQ